MKTIELSLEEQQDAAKRYSPNPEYDNRKERDGFLCGKPTGSSWCFCVAVKREDGVVSVRDTKDQSDTTLTFNSKEWSSFIKAVKDGEFDI